MPERKELKELLKKLHAAPPDELPLVKKELFTYIKGVDPKETKR